MSIRQLDALFNPKSIAIVTSVPAFRQAAETAVSTPVSMPALALADAVSYDSAALLHAALRRGGYKGPLHHVPSGQAGQAGEEGSGSGTTVLPATDLALICAPTAEWPAIVDALVTAGTRTAILYGDPATPLDTAVLGRAREGLLRLLGPASNGIVSSRAGVHANTGDTPALSGRVALISQSRSIANAAVAWASARHIGFSKVITSGVEADIDCGDLLDYLASDPETGAIALAIDFIAPRAMRKFLSAARAASRNKPVLVLRARHRRSDDALFSAAFRRAGMVRVESIEDLLDAIETLDVGRWAGSDAVTILANGGFTGALAADAVTDAGGRLATFSDTVLAALSRPVVPAHIANPINLGETASPASYDAAITALSGQSSTGALFIVHTPSVHATALTLAHTVAAHARSWPRGLMTCWLGDFDPAVREHLHKHKISVFPTPQRLARAFSAMREYQRNHVLLAETPESIGLLDVHAVRAARTALQRQIGTETAQGTLPEMAHDAAFALLATLLPHARARASVIRDGSVAEDGRDDMRHGDVRADGTADAAGTVDTADAADAGRQGGRMPVPLIGPFMHIEVWRDAAFGMVLRVTPPATFPGAARLEPQCAILPISTVLSGDLVMRLPSAPAHGHASFRAFTRFLARLSDVIVAIPEVSSLSLFAAHQHASRDEPDFSGPGTRDGRSSPMHAMHRMQGIVMRDCRIVAAPVDPDNANAQRRYRFAVRPYPAELETTHQWQGEAITVRPIKPQDEDSHRLFVESLTSEDLRMRFFGAVKTPEHSQLARMTQIDYDREMAFIATTPMTPTTSTKPPVSATATLSTSGSTSSDHDGAGVDADIAKRLADNDTDSTPDSATETLGVVRAVADPDNETAEFAVVVRSDRKGLRLGALLMQRIIAYCAARGTRYIVGEVLQDNTRMIQLARSLGFTVARSEEPGIRVLRLALPAASNGRDSESGALR